jgi:ribonuclease D
MWQARDDYARKRDIAPGRILPDSAIISAARSNATTEEALAALPIFGGPRQSRHLGIWLRALASAAALSDRDLPTMTATPDAVPPTSRWKERSPEAAARLARCRARIAELAEEYAVLGQNLLPSEVLRRLVWRLSEEKLVTAESTPSADTVAAILTELGARPWQIAMTTSALTEALAPPPETQTLAEAQTSPETPAPPPEVTEVPEPPAS